MKAVAPFQHAKTWNGRPLSRRVRASVSNGSRFFALSQEPLSGMSKKRLPESVPVK